MKTPRYNGAYPLAAEMVLAARLDKQARAFTAVVKQACIATYKAVARSGASASFNFNTDAADGKDVGVEHAAGSSLSPALVKKVRKYLKQKYGSNWSHLTRDKQTELIQAFIAQSVDVSPASAGKKNAIASLMSYGEYGAIPAHIIAGIQQNITSNLAKSYDVTNTGDISKAADVVKAISRNADAMRTQIEAADFGLTPDYWKNHYQKFTLDEAPLVDLVTGAPVTASTAGAVAPEIPALLSPVVELSTINSAPALEAVKKDAINNVEQNFQLIVRAAEGQRLGDGVKLSPEDLEDLISVDVFETNPELSAATDRWVEDSFNRIKSMNADAVKRGINVTQQAIKEGRSLPWLEEQLTKQMDISAGKARTIARTATSNAAWNAELATAKAAGMNYYRWRGMLDERERKQHYDREGHAYDPAHPPTDGNPGQPINCRCWPEWLFTSSDIEEAENEISTRHRD
ncbi:phage minor head protein [Citrobacter portucalensis]|uniref:phage minor head protein n=1 Tax=Citrobacter portucalensis TaxID=1639133 RepID=UPI002432ACB5|nr:phage minor head protein [Citrobacter portucalensis]WFZ22209.1 phage minor head protein [Citrobacter portucalensis]